MPDLYHSLLGYDLGHLRIVADLWGIELKSRDMDSAANELSASLLDPKLVAELTATLPLEARRALSSLVDAGGRIPYAAFTRKFGEVREMGAGRRDRERPHLNPSSTADILFYRALLARAFFDTEKGPQEFAYLPDDMLPLFQTRRGGSRKVPAEESVPTINEPLGRAATARETAQVIPADDRVLDDATTLLAALRLGHDLSPDPKVFALLKSAGFLSPSSTWKGKGERGVNAEKVKTFLEAPRTQARKLLNEAWGSSETFNELRLMPQLVCEGEWTNPVLGTRNAVLGFLASVPRDRWWSLDAFVSDIKKHYPDFQRPAGDYDSWFVKRASDGQYLRGFDSWDEVDGALIRFFIQVLHWLGRLDLAAPDETSTPTSFRLSSFLEKEEGRKILVTSTGKIVVPRLTPRAVRYQLARFCEWDDEGPEEYKYRITPQSLTRASEQGLKIEYLLALLAKHSDAGIPPSLVKALKRWGVNGTEARAETQVVLRVSRPEVLEELRKSKAARFLGEPLGPTSVVIKAGAQSKVIAALAEMGLLAEDNTAEAAVPGGDVELAQRTLSEPSASGKGARKD
jgi:hypothetical protein